MLDQVSRAAPALLAATKTPPGDAASGFNCFIAALRRVCGQGAEPAHLGGGVKSFAQPLCGSGQDTDRAKHGKGCFVSRGRNISFLDLTCCMTLSHAPFE